MPNSGSSHKSITISDFHVFVWCFSARASRRGSVRKSV